MWRIFILYVQKKILLNRIDCSFININRFINSLYKGENIKVFPQINFTGSHMDSLEIMVYYNIEI